MSGPVWRMHQGDEVSCNACLKPTSRAMIEGSVREGEFLDERSLCQDCYQEHIELINRSL